MSLGLTISAAVSDLSTFLDDFSALFLHENVIIEISIKSSIFFIFNIYFNYPTEPSRLISSNFCASTANSIGSLFNTSLLNPFTIKAIAFSVSIPL